MEIKLDNFVLSLSDTLRNAMLKLESLEEKLCVVCGAEGQIVRTVTDGDVRRFLLSGGSMDDKISSLPEKKPILALHGTPDAELLDAMVNNDIKTGYSFYGISGKDKLLDNHFKTNNYVVFLTL